MSAALHCSSHLTVSLIVLFGLQNNSYVTCRPTMPSTEIASTLLGSWDSCLICCSCSCSVWLSSLQYCRIPSSKDLPCPQNLYFDLKFKSRLISFYSVDFPEDVFLYSYLFLLFFSLFSLATRNLGAKFSLQLQQHMLSLDLSTHVSWLWSPSFFWLFKIQLSELLLL